MGNRRNVNQWKNDQPLQLQREKYKKMLYIILSSLGYMVISKKFVSLLTFTM